MKLINSMTKHPCIYTLLMSILVYPVYFAINAAYAHLMPIINNLMHEGQYWKVTSNWIPPVAMFAAIPWMIKTIILMIAAKNPFNKFGCFVNKFMILLDNVILYLPIALLIDAAFGDFLLPNHIALLAIVLTIDLIGFIGKIILKRKAMKVNYDY